MITGKVSLAGWHNMAERISFKRIRCAGVIRYAAYDKVSKTRVYVDDTWITASTGRPCPKGGCEFHISWNKKEEGDFFFPQTDAKFETIEEAFRWAFNIARLGRINLYRVTRGSHGT